MLFQDFQSLGFQPHRISNVTMGTGINTVLGVPAARNADNANPFGAKQAIDRIHQSTVKEGSDLASGRLSPRILVKGIPTIITVPRPQPPPSPRPRPRPGPIYPGPPPDVPTPPATPRRSIGRQAKTNEERLLGTTNPRITTVPTPQPPPSPRPRPRPGPSPPNPPPGVPSPPPTP